MLEFLGVFFLGFFFWPLFWKYIKPIVQEVLDKKLKEIKERKALEND